MSPNSLAKALLALDRQQDALAPLNQVLAHNPSDAEARELRGLVYRGLADYARAAEDLKAATESNPDVYLAQYNYGFVLARLDRLEEAQSHLEKRANSSRIRRRRSSSLLPCCANSVEATLRARS